MSGPGGPDEAGAEQRLGGQRPLTWAQALENPCLSCREAPCCTWLALHDFRVRRLLDLDYARYLLNFDRILLGVNANWEWRVYYHHPCRHLDRETSLCRVHDTPAQPATCRSYNPYDCDYKRLFAPRQDPDPKFLRIDRARLEVLAGACAFAEDRSLIGLPEWTALADALPPLALPEWGDDPPPDPALEARRAIARGERAPEPELVVGAGAHAAPCDGCAAACCRVLSFPHTPPHSAASFEHLRYCLGYPGVEIGVSEAGWTVDVRTTCRHLVRGPAPRCGVFGQPERPLQCSYYDETHCAYRARYLRPQPRASARITLEDFPALLGLFQFDGDGRIVAAPTLGEIQRAAGGGAPPPTSGQGRP